MRSPKEMFVVEPDRVVAELPQGEAQLKTLLKIGLVGLPAGQSRTLPHGGSRDETRTRDI